MLALVSFASSNYIRTLSRLYQEAIQTGCFNKLFFYLEKELDSSFWEQQKEWITKNHRLYGYAVWKPQIILQALNQLQDNKGFSYLFRCWMYY